MTSKKEKKIRCIFLIYNGLWFAAIFLLLPILIPIVLLSEKRRKTVLQRLGITARFRGTPFLKSKISGRNRVWIHALSVGEVISSIPIISKFVDVFNFQDIVFSASTKTGFEIANSLLENKVNDIFFFPYDLVLSVKYITGKVDPDLVIIVETDIWPNFLNEMKRRCVPVILVNARLSEKSFFNYKRFAFFSKPIFSAFSYVCTQSAVDAKRFRMLGVPYNNLKVIGNVKFDQPEVVVNQTEKENLKRSLNIHPQQRIFLAGSTHKGEEEIIADAFSRIKKSFGDYLLIIAPRDPERADSVSRIFQSSGFSVIRQTNITCSKSENSYEVIVIDAIGHLKRLYAIADIAFIGGSLKPFGGHNPLEAAAFSTPILLGPDMSDFADISEKLLESNAAVLVKNAQDIYNAATMLISDRKTAEQAGSRAFEVFNTNKGAVERTMKVIETFLKGMR